MNFINIYLTVNLIFLFINKFNCVPVSKTKAEKNISCWYGNTINKTVSNKVSSNLILHECPQVDESNYDSCRKAIIAGDDIIITYHSCFASLSIPPIQLNNGLNNNCDENLIYELGDIYEVNDDWELDSIRTSLEYSGIDETIRDEFFTLKDIDTYMEFYSLSCPIVCDNKMWECNENDLDFEECMRIIIPDITRQYYVDRAGVQRQMTTAAFMISQFFGKTGDIKYRCRGVNIWGFNDHLAVTNYVADWNRNELKINTKNPKITVDSSHCTNGNLGKIFGLLEGSDVQISLYEVKMEHTISFYISRVGKVYIQDWRIKINPAAVLIDHPENMGTSDRSMKGFEFIEKGLGKAIGDDIIITYHSCFASLSIPPIQLNNGLNNNCDENLIYELGDIYEVNDDWELDSIRTALEYSGIDKTIRDEFFTLKDIDTYMEFVVYLVFFMIMMGAMQKANNYKLN
ncbi:hypothetical protein HCN44_009477 [Aphidius gifuensis]|uniref:Odorant-binding protein n=1 Tax=Aphidius gifuensis TaxID=684658 RepID=A0A834Y6D5_APHGI|nr:hypothetical protein HCN44_009477 [Aphidius gifuensis]